MHKKRGQNHITQTNHAISVWAAKRNNLYMLMKTALIDKTFIFAFACKCLCISSCCFSSPLNSRRVRHCGAILKIVPRHSYTADSKMSKVQHSKTVLKQIETNLALTECSTFSLRYIRVLFFYFLGAELHYISKSVQDR